MEHQIDNDAFEKYLPEMYSTFDEGRDLLGTEKEAKFITKTYTVCRNISIDYGIMEKAENVYVCAPISAGLTWGHGAPFLSIRYPTGKEMRKSAARCFHTKARAIYSTFPPEG
jgi:mannose-1-phosphate guanylyltransferase